MARVFLHLRMAKGGGRITPQGYLGSQTTYEQNSNGYTHVFGVKLFNGANPDVTGSRHIPEIEMAVAETGSHCISGNMTSESKIPATISILRRSTYSMATEFYCMSMSRTGSRNMAAAKPGSHYAESQLLTYLRFRDT